MSVKKLGSFRIEQTLGAGAMGTVYRAVHEGTGRPAAVKVMNPDVSGKSQKRFEREYEILKQFRHPNIVRWYTWGKSGETYYMAMEFVKGRTLDAYLEETGALGWREVVELGIQLADALQYAHDHGVVHRDLKPSNLMLSEEGALKLTDFGIAKDLDRTALTATGRTLGTAAYMAPEQIRGTPEISHKTDLYALGVVFYQMLTGQLPFEGNSAVVMMNAHINTPAPRASNKLAEIPKTLDDLVLQLLAKKPEDRPWDAAAVANTLREIREKSSKGETVRMVWPAANPDPLAATIAATATPGANAGAPADATSSAPKKKKSRKKSAATSEAGDHSTRRMLETLGLAAALVGIGGVIGYLVWPPGQEYLYRQAEKEMASEKRHDWIHAIEYYIDPLDRRFPDHPHKEQVRVWRDKLLLEEVEGRAAVLSSAVETQLSRPNTDQERLFVSFQPKIAAARSAGDDLRAIVIWNEFDKLLKPDQPEDRPFHLLARKRVGELEKDVATRAEQIKSLCLEATKARLEGRVKEMEQLYAQITERYGKYSDVKELLRVYAPELVTIPVVPPGAGTGTESAPGSPPP